MRDTRGRFRSRLTRIEKTKKFNTVMGVVTLLVLAGLILYATFRSPKILDPKGSPKSLGQTIIPKVEEAKAFETPCDYDPITYLRCRGKQLGISDYKITQLIQVAKCESGLNPDALNKNTNGSFDVGVFQINTVHKQKNMTDFVKNIDYGYKLYQEQGLRPWVCARKLGLVN